MKPTHVMCKFFRNLCDPSEFLEPCDHGTHTNIIWFCALTHIVLFYPAMIVVGFKKRRFRYKTTNVGLCAFFRCSNSNYADLSLHLVKYFIFNQSIKTTVVSVMPTSSRPDLVIQESTKYRTIQS